jgi:hypothetical protein
VLEHRPWKTSSLPACSIRDLRSQVLSNSEPASVSTWQPSISMAPTPFPLLLWEMLRHHHFVLPSCNSEPVSLSSWQPSISSMAASFATITSCQVGAATLTANNGVASSQPVFSSSDFKSHVQSTEYASQHGILFPSTWRSFPNHTTVAAVGECYPFSPVTFVTVFFQNTWCSRQKQNNLTLQTSKNYITKHIQHT